MIAWMAVLAMPGKTFARQTNPETDANFGYFIEPFHYSGSDRKSNGFSAGLYTRLTYGPHHGIETLIRYKRIDFKTKEDFRQWDYTGIYTHYRGRYQYRGGLHFANTNYVRTDGAVTLVAGLGRRLDNQWRAAVDGYFTYYNDEKPDLNVYQLTPTVGHYIFQASDNSLLVEITGHYIHIDANGFFGQFLEEKDFYSAEATVTYEYHNWMLTGSGWAGEQVFAVGDDGFDVNYLNEKYTGGFSAGIAYGLDTGIRIGLEIDADFYEEIFTDDDGTRLRYGVNFGSRF